MKYIGMPMGMWVLFAGSFQKQLTAVLGYDANAAKAITKKAKPKYREIISEPVSYTHLTLPTTIGWCRSRWSPYH